MALDLSGLAFSFGKFQFRHNTDYRRRVWVKLSKLIQNGVNIIDAIQSMRQRRFREYGASDPVVLAMDAWVRHLKNGRKLNDAVADWVPPQERMLIAAGERSGKLADALMSSAAVMVAQRDIKRAVIGGLAYPILLVIAVFGMLFFFGYKLIPTFSRIVPDDKWSGMASFVVGVSHWVQHWLWLPAALLLLGGGWLLWALPNWVGAYRVKADRWPLFATYRLVTGSAWIISLSAMVGAGERIEDALNLLSKGVQPFVESRTQSILRGLRNGLNLGDAMSYARTGFPDPEIIDDLATFSAVAGLDEALKTIAREWISDSVESIRSSMKVVFNIGLVAVAVVLGVMMTGLIAMQMQMGQLIQHGAH